jgi:hypothetical protein
MPDGSFHLFSGAEISRKKLEKNVLLTKVVKVEIEKS